MLDDEYMDEDERMTLSDGEFYQGERDGPALGSQPLAPEDESGMGMMGAIQQRVRGMSDDELMASVNQIPSGGPGGKVQQEAQDTDESDMLTGSLEQDVPPEELAKMLLAKRARDRRAQSMQFQEQARALNQKVMGMGSGGY